MFDDNDMTEARKGIAKLLLHSKVTQSDDVCKSRHLLLSGKMTKNHHYNTDSKLVEHHLQDLIVS